MTQEEKIVQKVISQELKNYFGPNRAEHSEHHDYVRRRIAKDAIWEKRVEKWKTSGIGSIIILLVGGIGTFLLWLGNIVLEHFHKGGQ